MHVFRFFFLFSFFERIKHNVFVYDSSFVANKAIARGREIFNIKRREYHVIKLGVISTLNRTNGIRDEIHIFSNVYCCCCLCERVFFFLPFFYSIPDWVLFFYDVAKGKVFLLVAQHFFWLVWRCCYLFILWLLAIDIGSRLHGKIWTLFFKKRKAHEFCD